VQNLNDETAKQQRKEFVELYSDILAITFDKATAYLNLVALGGYASFFGIWSLLGSDIGKGEKVLSAFFMGVSVLLFVAFEVFKMATIHHQLSGLRELVTLPDTTPLEQLQLHQSEFQSAQTKADLIATRVWLMVFPTCIVFALLGALVLLWAFAEMLRHLWGVC
jgi:hypothetical protein